MKNKSSSNKKTNIINKYNILSVNLQVIMTIAVVVFGIISFIKPNFYKWFQLVLALNFIVIGYNNYLIYRREKFTIVYVGIGILFLILSVLSFVGIVL